MINIRTMAENDLGSVASFIAKLNRCAASHIGYCDTDKQSIMHYFETELDIPYTDCFVLAMKEDTLIGVAGFDADLENKVAEIWGPFIMEGHWGIRLSMWDKMMELLPHEIKELMMFPNEKNEHVQQLATERQFNKISKEAILVYSRKSKRKSLHPAITALSEQYFSEFQQLHNKTFPKAYYHGQQILNRMNDHRKVLIMTHPTQALLGYIYMEVEPEFGDASIEFFAVKETERGKGIGGKMIEAGLDWIFSFHEIASVNLCVNAKNENAIRLYKKVGFKQMHALCAYTKKI